MVPLAGTFGLLMFPGLSPARAQQTRYEPLDDLQGVPKANLPNGKMTTCEIKARRVDVDGRKTMFVLGGSGVFGLVLPEAPDWKPQCDDQSFLWGHSKSARMPVTVSPYEPRQSADVSPRKYLSAIASKMKQGMESSGVRMTKSSIWPLLEVDARFTSSA